nr:hypothetical protein [Tanacetum cinerariifolium]
MALTFADTHNMIVFLTKSNAHEGFDQIVNFLNAHVIQYALMVNLTIYVSCIKQFWTFVSIKKSNDVMRLQSLINRKKVIITEDIIRQALRLDDADGVDCLPNEEIFVELAKMGYEKTSTKLTFYKAFFLTQWKFLIHTILQCMSAKRIVWNEFSSSTASTVICLETENKNDDNEVSVEPTPPSPTPATPPPSPIQENIPSPPQTCATLTKHVANLEQDKVAHAIEITKLKKRVRRRSRGYIQTGGGITELDADEDVTLEDVDAEVAMDDDDTDEAEPTKVKEVIEVVTVAKLMTEVVTTAVTTIIDAQVPKASALRRRKGVVIHDPEETATPSDAAFARQLKAKLSSNINWSDVMDSVKRKEKQDNTVMRYQALKRKPVTEANPRKNMIVYLKNMAGFKMDFFKGEEEITEQEKRSKTKDSSPEHRTAKKQRIDEDEEELKIHLHIIVNDDDVFTKATPLALKKPNVKARIWREQKGRYGLAKLKSSKLLESCGVHIITFTTTRMIMLVERKYPLTRFTLEQMLNNVRLEVEEESEMSLELLRLVRKQLQEGYIPE